MDVTGLIAAIFVLGSPAYIVAKIQEHRTKRAQIDADAKRQTNANPKELEALRAERKLLVERIENRETIVCSVDQDLNQKLVKLIDEKRLLEPAAASPTPPSLDRTMTAPVPKARSAGELIPGDILAGRYKIERLLGRGGM